VSEQSRYARLLRLRQLRPSSWQRALFVEGTLLAAVVLVLADLASAWLLLAAPLAVAAAVKFVDAISAAAAAAPGQAPTASPRAGNDARRSSGRRRRAVAPPTNGRSADER
jgi:hypothetical protein